MVRRHTREGEDSQIERLLERVRQDNDILAVILFGSSVRQEKTSLSDQDICLIMAPKPRPFDSFSLSIKRLEYLKDFTFDVHIFQRLPLFVRRRVLKEGKVLFVRDEELLYKIAFRTAQSFEDFKHIYYSYLREVEIAGSGTPTR